MKNLKKLVALFMVLVFALSMAACSNGSGETNTDFTDWAKVEAAAKKEGKVTVYSNFPQDIEQGIFEEFGKHYGIDVEYIKIGGSVPTMNKYITEAENDEHVVDLIQMSSLTAATVAEKGYAAEIPAAMPNLKNLSPDFPANDTFIPTVIEAIVIVYNTNMITPEELPNTYEELTDPKYAGKWIIGSPENSANTIKFMQGCKELYGEDFVTRLAGLDIMEVDKEVTAADLVAKGERPFAVMCQNAASVAIQSGAPLSFKAMETTFIGQNGIILPYEAPHPNAARLLANWMLGETHQGLFVDKVNAITTTTFDIAPKGIPALADMKTYSPDQDAINQNSTALMAEWRAAIGAN